MWSSDRPPSFRNPEDWDRYYEWRDRKSTATPEERAELRESLARYREWMAAVFDAMWADMVRENPDLRFAKPLRNPFR